MIGNYLISKINLHRVASYLIKKIGQRKNKAHYSSQNAIQPTGRSLHTPYGMGLVQFFQMMNLLIGQFHR